MERQNEDEVAKWELLVSDRMEIKLLVRSIAMECNTQVFSVVM